MTLDFPSTRARSVRAGALIVALVVLCSPAIGRGAGNGDAGGDPISLSEVKIANVPPRNGELLGADIVRIGIFAPRDRWYGFNNKQFQNWFHRCWKVGGAANATKEDIERAFAEWQQEGRPQSDRCRNRRQK